MRPNAESLRRPWVRYAIWFIGLYVTVFALVSVSLRFSGCSIEHSDDADWDPVIECAVRNPVLNPYANYAMNVDGTIIESYCSSKEPDGMASHVKDGFYELDFNGIWRDSDFRVVVVAPDYPDVLTDDGGYMSQHYYLGDMVPTTHGPGVIYGTYDTTEKIKYDDGSSNVRELDLMYVYTDWERG